MSKQPQRFPRAVFDQGSEPDARFSLANERTFLAWIRTGLALVALGVAIEAFAGPIADIPRRAAAAILVLAGAVAPLQAWFGWRRAEVALRLNKPLPNSPGGLIIVTAVVLSSVLVLFGLLTVA
ncbi:YidH family protein [Nigerium massiliense]|uniref:YidH family protein n=1 Tax=Nigerium massiliense TaxID=1522317 RepID=UPI00058EEDA6|nr:DUF202 domain-containing protein [Nigerium massiliense]